MHSVTERQEAWEKLLSLQMVVADLIDWKLFLSSQNNNLEQRTHANGNSSVRAAFLLLENQISAIIL